MKIFCLDPGVTTGWCIFEHSKDTNSYEISELGHFKTLAELVNKLKPMHRDWAAVRMLYEGFARGNSAVKEQLQTIEMCGAIRALGVLFFDREPVKQYPESRKTYVPLAKFMLKHCGYTPLGDYTHAIDAVAHGLAYMQKEGIDWNRQYWMQLAYPSVD